MGLLCLSLVSYLTVPYRLTDWLPMSLPDASYRLTFKRPSANGFINRLLMYKKPGLVTVVAPTVPPFPLSTPAPSMPHENKRRSSAMPVKISLDDTPSIPVQVNEDLLALDLALHELGTFDEQQSRIVELRYFGGLTIEETAEVLEISPATVKRDWVMARTWLYQKINGA